MWNSIEQGHLEAGICPEIKQKDLSQLTLELINWGINDVSDLPWLDEPNRDKVKEAKQLLTKLNALDRKTQQLSEHGKMFVNFGVHPRLAHMLIRAADMGYGELGCMLAAVLNEGDIFRVTKTSSAEIELRIEALLDKKSATEPLIYR
eukprot:TRINITY_DN50286_c1_g1_i1.p1 TRINITY_DN50286_c1_g1~~TRINITY_DN50286_c1_g1_i1.p1  ORF type:complete len:148 (-),score=20.44 TRINITY_DN50286_c1_g1_i1:84-527(-)